MEPLPLNWVLILTSLHAITAVLGCTDGFVPWHEGYCYSPTVSDSEWWDYSVDLCREHGGELASIHSALENKRIAAALSTYGKDPVWTGLHCSGAATWTDNTPVNYLNDIRSDCTRAPVYSAWTTDSTGAWTKQDMGYEILWGLCRHRRRNGERCSDYDEVDGSGACISIHTEPQSWWLAENQCRQEGGHLLSIHDQKLNKHVAKRISDAEIVGTSGAFHIGMQSYITPKGENLTWSDGSTVNYTNFDTGYPDDLFGHCTAMQSTLAGKRITTQCDQSALPYICSRPVNDPIELPGCPNNPYFKDSGTILSPSYPAGSGPITSCGYFLSVQQGMKVNLTINDLNMNLCCDKLMLYDGASATTPFATLSGKAAQTSYTTPSSNVLKMIYSSTDGTFVRGWKVSFHGV